ncbi:MAG: ATP-binding protein [Bacilli bacterium]
MKDDKICAEVISVNPDKIKIAIYKIDDFKTAEDKLRVGSYLEIKDENDDESCYTVVAIIDNFKIDLVTVKNENEKGEVIEEIEQRYILEASPLGSITEGKFVRGGETLSIPPKSVEIASNDVIQKIFGDSIEENARFCFSKLANNETVLVNVNGNKLFNKHLAIVGSSGSGKSHTTAKIIQNAVALRKDENCTLNNSHIIIFDIHSEYATAFPEANIINIDNLILPYWLLNGDELEELFLDSGDNNNYNQSSLLRTLITLNKKKYIKCNGVREDLENIDFDSPVKFDVTQIYTCLKNLKLETYDYGNDLIAKYYPEEKEYNSISEKYNDYFDEILKFQNPINSKIKRGTYSDGTIDKFINRFYNKINDKRMQFLFGEASKKIDFVDVIKNFTGYNSKSNVTIIDLSGVPFEVLSITVSLISRLLFDFSYYNKKINSENKIPLLLVFEEAHKYVPKSDLARFKSSKLAIERIAKEGRKYGVTLAIVSQRPSEISETIFSQCNTFIAMRLTNPDDQNYVKKLLPDTLGNLTSKLNSLSAGEALLIGESVPMPSIVKIDRCGPEPSSNDLMYLDIWKDNWYEDEFTELIKKWEQ